MKLQTARTVIREFSSNDIEAFMEYRNDLEWMRYQGFKGLSKEIYEKALLSDPSLDDGKQYAIIDAATSQLLGDVYLRREQRIYWIGYTIHPRFKQQGYAKEAVTALITWLSEQECNCIKAGVLPENIASIRLLETLGFVYLTQAHDELVYVYDMEKEIYS